MRRLHYSLDTDGHGVWESGGHVGIGRSEYCRVTKARGRGREENNNCKVILQRNHQHVTMLLSITTNCYSPDILCNNLSYCPDRWEWDITEILTK